MARTGPRILAGLHRGRVLRVARSARPTEGRVREALFNIWADRVVDQRFLDLFAGSGAMGLEALSRGAGRVTWVEKDGQAVQTIRRNLELLGCLEDPGAERRMQVLRLDLPRQAERLCGGSAGRWDLVFADPPYAFGAYDELATSLAPALAASGELAVEHSHRLGDDAFGKPPGLRVADRRTWGDCAVTFFRLGSQSDGSAP